jgi:23S rRNA (cytidine1920-2'-O)/16S rRNA (cytidine1409-2'-O)-methyltransferase
MRLDIHLTNHPQIQSRNKASELIRNKKIKVDGVVITKTSFHYEEGMEIEILEDEFFVSRAAYKLKYFLFEIDVELKDKTALDIGSSTGGFTQILLKNDIASVTCVDVGTNQLHETIRDDKRITVFEKTDVRDFKPDTTYDVVTCDVSFISILHILEDIARLAHKDVIILFKPQYEVGQSVKRNSNGVVQDPLAIRVARDRFISEAFKLGLNFVHASPSKVAGKEGNIEELFYFKK